MQAQIPEERRYKVDGKHRNRDERKEEEEGEGGLGRDPPEIMVSPPAVGPASI